MMKTDNQKRINVLLAILIAFTAWAYVIYTTDPSTTKVVKDVPVEFSKQYVIDDAGLAVKSIDTDKIDVVIEGNRSVVGSVTADDIKAIVNLEDAGKGENTLEISIKSPSNTTASNRSKREAIVTIEDKTYDVVDGRAEYTDAPDVATVTTEPFISDADTYEYQISGAKSLVDKVEYVRLPLSVENVGGNKKTFEVRPIPIDSEGNVVNFVSVDPNETSIEAFSAGIKSVPLKLDIDTPDDGKNQVTYNAPTDVIIKGTQADLDKVKEITTLPITTEGMTQSDTIEIEYNLPEGIQVGNASIGEVVHVKVIPYESKTISIRTSKIQVKNLDSDYTSEFTDDTITLRVIGLGTNIKPLTADDFKLSVDAKDLGVGTYGMEVTATTDALVYKVESVTGDIYLSIKSK